VSAPAAVIATNVVVSGLITTEPSSSTAVIVDGMIEGRFPYLLSLDLLAEYREVLLRSGIRRHHGLDEAEVETLLTELAMNGSVRDVPPSAEALPDVDDRHLWAPLDDDPTAVLVTGDDALLRRAPSPHRVMSPRSFLSCLERA
jgi:uncharacterized protein